jgi:hypothetical protein
LASIRLPKNFHPVGTSNTSFPLALATLEMYSKHKFKNKEPKINVLDQWKG